MIDLYRSSPITVRYGIPVFSEPDHYTQNYEQIAHDHLKVFEAEGRNPFMNERHWRDCEDSTALLIGRYARDGNSILDVGVGMGRLLGRFPKLRRYGMDISEAYLKHASEQGIEVCYAKIEDMPYAENIFDIVTCTDVLEHVLDLHLSFTRLMSVLKPGGTLIMRVPYREDLSFYLSPECPYEFIHLRNFDEHGIALMVQKIFGHSLIEQTFAGYRGGNLRFGSRIPKFEVATKVGLDLVERKVPAFGGAIGTLRRKLFTATVINSVIRKAAA